MENFKTKSEYNFIKNLSPRLFAIDSSYKTNKAKLMRDIKLLRTALDGRIPEVTANDGEQLQILLKKCKTDLKSEVDACFSSDENMNTDYLNAVTSEVENSKEKTEPVPDQLVRRKDKKRRNKRHKNKHRKRRRKFSSSSSSDTDGHENVRNKITCSPTNSNNIFCNARHITFLEIPVPVALNVIPYRQVSFVYLRTCSLVQIIMQPCLPTSARICKRYHTHSRSIHTVIHFPVTNQHICPHFHRHLSQMFILKQSQDRQQRN